MSLARTSLIIFIMRISNVGLMMIGPILLARLLPVHEFGLYREFLVYSGVLMTISAFGLSQGLMYLAPANSGHTWALVRQTVILTATTGLLVTAVAAVANVLSGGELLGSFGAAVLAYTLLYINIDFWEHLWLAQKKPALAFYYTSGRLALRLTTVAIAALLTRNIATIIQALLALEALRLLASAIAWKLLKEKDKGSPHAGLWAAQLRYCLPIGMSLVVTTINGYIGSILITVSLGTVMLAQYAVGTYAVPVLFMLRNSVSDALLPHMASSEPSADGTPSLDLWHKSNTLFAIMLIPLGLLLARFAELIVVVLFSSRYLPAVIVFQVYLLSILTHLVDFGVPLRLLGKTSVYLYSTVAGIVVNVALLALLLPKIGMLGAIFAVLGAEVVSMTVHTIVLSRLTRIRPAALLGLRSIGRVAAACAVPLPLLAIPVGSSAYDIPLATLLSILYVLAFVLLLWRIGTPEVREMLGMAWTRLPPFITRRHTRMRS
ncbi:MAG: oligosaccharide flippase family protein [Steroidobacteraceae bacterium]